MPDRTIDVYQLRFSVEKALKYHQRREGHYDFWNRFLLLIGILSGSAAFANAFGDLNWFGLGCALFAALGLVTDFSHKARDHEILRRRFSELAAKITRCGGSVDEATLRDWQAQRIEIEEDEKPTFWAVDHDCHNEVCIAWEHNDLYVPLPLRKRLFMNWLRFDKVAKLPVLSSSSSVVQLAKGEGVGD